MNKSRLEAFMDAIVVIAATIMVLASLTNDRQGILEVYPAFLTYVINREKTDGSLSFSTSSSP